MLLHDLQELYDHLGHGANEHLPLAALLGIVDGVEAVIEHADPDHRSLSQGDDPPGCRR